MTTSGTAPTPTYFPSAVLSRTDQRLWIFGGDTGVPGAGDTKGERLMNG